VPTYIILDPKGKEIKRDSGYRAGGPKAFTDWLAASK
jgi:hypothetical protein